MFDVLYIYKAFDDTFVLAIALCARLWSSSLRSQRT